MLSALYPSVMALHVFWTAGYNTTQALPLMQFSQEFTPYRPVRTATLRVSSEALTDRSRAGVLESAWEARAVTRADEMSEKRLFRTPDGTLQQQVQQHGYTSGNV